MIIIDNVYQKVLALSNKEQRGYVTPQEFNLMANKAQLEIYDSYFHDLKTAYHKPTKSNMTHGDDIDILNEKLHPFRSSSSFTLSTGENSISIGDDMYMIDNITKTATNVNSGVAVEVVEMDQKDILYTENNPLTKATSIRPVYARDIPQSSTVRSITVYPTATQTETYSVNYYKTPSKPHWDYVVVNEKALYNSTYSVNFELHKSEEEILVSRILQLAGIVIMKPGIVEIGATEKSSIKQEQNN